MTDDVPAVGLANELLGGSRAAEVVTGKRRRPHFWTHAFLLAISVLFFFPLGWAIFTSLRPYGETARLGYVSVGGTYTLDNFFKAAQGLMRSTPASTDYMEGSILDTRTRQTESLIKEQALQDKVDH